MSLGFVSGARLWSSDTDDHKEDLRDGLDWLSPDQDGIAFLKKVGIKGFTFHNPKYEWTETALAPRKELVTIDDSSTSLDVASSAPYTVGTLLKIEDEVVRVTALADSNTLTVTRGYGNTDAAAHTAKYAITMGTADPENSDAQDGITHSAAKLYNYQQTFQRSVEMSNDELDALTTAGNPLTNNSRARMIEIMRELSAAVWYGERDVVSISSKNAYSMGGLNYFGTTNVENMAGAPLSIAAVDALIKAEIDAGGNPNVIVSGTTQKQFLDALDTNRVRTTKGTRTGGDSIANQWQSGLMNGTLEIIVDHTLLEDELYVLDTRQIDIGYKMGRNGHRGFRYTDTTPIGRDGVKKTIRGKYGLRLNQETGSFGKLYNLATS